MLGKIGFLLLSFFVLFYFKHGLTTMGVGFLLLIPIIFHFLSLRREREAKEKAAEARAKMEAITEAYERSKRDTRTAYDSQGQATKSPIPHSPPISLPPKMENVVIQQNFAPPPERDKSLISPHQMPPDYYKILGISHSVSLEEIKQAAKTKGNDIKTAFTVLSHPDQRTTYDVKPNLGPHNHYATLLVKKLTPTAEIRVAAQARMKEIKEAYENLSKPETRAAYDSQWQVATALIPHLPPIPPQRENVVVEPKPAPPPDRNKFQVSPSPSPPVSLTHAARYTKKIELADTRPIGSFSMSKLKGAYLLFSLFLLLVGAVEAYRGWKAPEPTRITVADYVNSNKSKEWVVLTDAKINLLKAVGVTTTITHKSGHISEKGLTELYIPIESAGFTQNDTVSLLLETDDEEILNVCRQLMAMSEAKQLQFSLENMDKLIRSVELSGRVLSKYSMESMESSREKEIRTKHIKNLASDFYILKHNHRPEASLMTGLTIMGTSLLMLTPLIALWAPVIILPARRIRQGKPASKRTLLLLTFFLGWVGAHRFYLGNYVISTIYLLFFWTGIPSWIAFAEFLWFLFISSDSIEDNCTAHGAAVAVVFMPMVAIFIGIVVGITAYTDYLKRGKVSEAIELLGQLETPTEKYMVAKGEFPPTIDLLTKTTSGKYVASLVSKPEEFYFEASMSWEDRVLAGKTVRLIYDPNKKTWSCSAAYPNGIPQKYLSSKCKKY